MLKNILKVKGAQQLSTNEQKAIKGGIDGYYCYVAISQTQCSAAGGKWSPIGMCVMNRIAAEDNGYSCS